MKIDLTTRLLLAIVVVVAAAMITIFLELGTLATLLVAATGLAIMLLCLDPSREAEPHSVRSALLSENGSEFADAVADPLLILAGSRVEYANAAAMTLLGAHIMSQDVRTALRHPDIGALLSDTEGIGTAEISGIGDQGQIWEARVAQAGSGKRIIHLIDRTARHAAERARVDFVANASHELRTPLATLLGYIETLRDEGAGGDPPTRNRFLSIMDSEAQRMQRLVSDLMSLSRIEAEKHAIPEADVNLSALVSKVALERPDHVHTDIEISDGIVKGDAAQLSQLLHNLLDNAVKYGGCSESVTLRISRGAAGAITLAVQDKGMGIAPEHLPRLTERFYRVDPGRSRSAGGTGLGLSIVKHIVQHHRALLTIDSAVGEGTCVTVEFPASETAVT
jgi:two-component system, OmpR family, phosphate regulon sensor histidine kinase PhoR